MSLVTDLHKRRIVEWIPTLLSVDLVIGRLITQCYLQVEGQGRGLLEALEREEEISCALLRQLQGKRVRAQEPMTLCVWKRQQHGHPSQQSYPGLRRCISPSWKKKMSILCFLT